ncbi:MAG: DUF1461 domain-containing protein [Thiotrichaceae bacterium]|nr:DUF1461 domain-containing protein [Thiotrichaceae bacterium]
MQRIFWGLFLVFSFIITLPASWWALSKVDFGYDFLYDRIGISAHIDRYVPRNNKNKKDFVLTTKAERVHFFHVIAEAIHNKGEGLVELSYSSKNKKLLTNAEVVHLQDVANLLDKLEIILWVALILWLVVLIILRFKRIKLPPANQLLISTVIITLVFTVVLSFGPEMIFNQLHVWVFPDNHQWFFYYEESLMSTMMKAPDLFAYIAGIWALLSLILTIFLLQFLKFSKVIS